MECLLCGGGRAERVFSATDRLGLARGVFQLVRCTHCGFVYLDPRPDESELVKFYPPTYWGGKQRGVRELLRGIEERLKERYKLGAVTKAGLTGGRVLDVGCGRGEFLRILKDKGFEVTGVEPGLEAARMGREDFSLDIIHGSLGAVKLPEAYFDAATLWHVLEHLPDPAGALKELNRALKPGGALLMALPDFGGWQAGVFRERWFGIDAPRHLSHFTRRTLSAMLSDAGFEAPLYLTGSPRYETAMLVRSAFPGLNGRKLSALGNGRPSKYVYKAVQLALDTALLPAGAWLVLSNRGCTMTAVARKSARS